MCKYLYFYYFLFLLTLDQSYILFYVSSYNLSSFVADVVHEKFSPKPKNDVENNRNNNNKNNSTELDMHDVNSELLLRQNVALHFCEKRKYYFKMSFNVLFLLFYIGLGVCVCL